MQHIEIPRARAAGRRRMRRTVIAFLLAAAGVLALVASGVGEDADRARTSASLPPAQSGAVPISVRITLRHPGRRVPPRFLGLSFEASSLPQIATYGASGNFVRLLRSLGPGLLRFGGVSADTRIAWTDAATPRPAWTSSVLEAGDLRRLGVLAARSGWRVLLTVGLAHYEPLAAAREVREAKRALGSSLAGVEIGNEPDAFARHGLRPLPWNPAVYDAEVRAYRTAIRRLSHGIRFASPGVSGSHSFLKWGPASVRAQRPALLTGHHYPLGCHQSPPPSIADLLSEQTRHLEAISLVRYLSVSRRSRIPFRMDEANSVSCGGRAGVSDTFASALWASDYISQAMAAGATGINLQGNPANCLGYTPVCGSSPAYLQAGVLTARPVWYALLLTKGLIGDRPLRTSVSSTQPANVAVRALRTPNGGLHIVIVDEDPPGSRPVSLSLHVGRRFRAGSVLELSAPSPQASSGVTLGGRAVARDGSWQALRPLPRAAVRAGVMGLTVAPSSAVLLTVARAHSRRRG
jgi:hypothetical protein